MTLQSSGAISLYDVNIELGRSGAASINMNEAAVRTLAGVPSGSYGMNSFYGKSNYKYNGSITTVSQAYYTSGGQFYNIFYGLFTSAYGSYGSRSPTTLVDGKTLAVWEDYDQYDTYNSYETANYGHIAISGFSGDPGIGYITNAQIASNAIRTPNAYNYYGGMGHWYFTKFGFNAFATQSAKIR